jgi:predicted Zn-dependent protease
MTTTDAARGRRTIGLVAALLLALAAAGCSAIGTGGPTAAIFSGDASLRGGADSEEHARIVAAYGGVYRDDHLEQALAGIVSRVVAASDRPEQPYRITILNAPAINAFALPDGHLYLTRGLLALANDSAEIAAVLAHEMGHVTANHAQQRETRARNTLIARQTLNDVISDEESRRMALAASQRSLAAFSRQQELEADSIGIRTVSRAGYDPFAASRFLTAMAKFADYRAIIAAPEGRPDFLSTHPTTPERVQLAEQTAREIGGGAADIARDRYLDGINGMVYGDDPSQGFVRDRRFVHPGLAIGFAVPNGFVIDNTSDAVLATGPDGTALRFDAVAVAEGMDLPAYLRSGWVNGLDDNSIQSFAINGLAAASARAQAKGWRFQIVVIQADGPAAYRFIFANEADSEAFRQAANATVGTFRTLSAPELAAFKPLRVRVVTAAAGDTELSLSRQMRGVDRGRDLFDLINGLAPGTPVAPGTRLKVVTDR